MSSGTSEQGQVSTHVGISTKCSLVPKMSHPIGPPFGISPLNVGGGVDSDAYFAQLFIMQQRTEDMRSELLTAIAENKRYMQAMNTNVRRISQFRHIISTKVID